MVELIKLFGDDSCPVLHTLVDHAKGNPFFKALSAHYGLTWHRVPLKKKQPADAFEAWVGAVSRENAMYDIEGPMTDLRWFVHRLMVVRYQHLSHYSTIESMTDILSQNMVVSSNINCEEIRLAKILEELGGAVTEKHANTEWNICVGFLAEATLSGSATTAVRAFNFSQDEAKLRLNSGRGKRYRLLGFR